nr:hypothetical protein [Candidatus Sigynarchaeota archaeon]
MSIKPIEGWVNEMDKDIRDFVHETKQLKENADVETRKIKAALLKLFISREAFDNFLKLMPDELEEFGMAKEKDIDVGKIRQIAKFVRYLRKAAPSA